MTDHPPVPHAGASPSGEQSEPWFGCFTGNCPHETQAECDAAIRAEFARLERAEKHLRDRLADIEHQAPRLGELK